MALTLPDHVNPGDTGHIADTNLIIDALAVLDTRSGGGTVYHDVRDYGAVGDGSNDDTAAIQAALDSFTADGGVVILPHYGPWKTSSALIMRQGVALLGQVGAWARILCTNAADDGIRIDPDGWGGWRMSNIDVGGVFDTGIVISTPSVYQTACSYSSMNQMHVSGTGTNGFRFGNTFHASYSNLSTTGAHISNACFQILACVNGVNFENLYTGGPEGHLYCVYVDDTEQPEGALDYLPPALSITLSNPTLQGGRYGVYVVGAESLSIDNPYFENVAQTIVLGVPGAQGMEDSAQDARVRSAIINGGAYMQTTRDTTWWDSRGPIFSIQSARGVIINAPRSTWEHPFKKCTVSGGGGTGAEVFMAMNIDGGPIHYMVASPGSGYTSNPTVTAPAPLTGTADTLVVTRTGNRVTGVSVGTPGTANYGPDQAFPAYLLYGRNVSRTVVNAPAMTYDDAPFHVTMFRDKYARAVDSVSIIGDNASAGYSQDLRKVEGAADMYALAFHDSTGAPAQILRQIPVVERPRVPVALLNEAVWWVDSSRRGSGRLTDLSTGGHDAVFGAGGAAPTVLPYTPGTVYLSVPTDSGGLAIGTGSEVQSSGVVVVLKGRIDNIGADEEIFDGVPNSGATSWVVLLRSGNIVSRSWDTTGEDITLAPLLNEGWHRFTKNGLAVSYHTSVDGSAWTLRGSGTHTAGTSRATAAQYCTSIMGGGYFSYGAPGMLEFASVSFDGLITHQVEPRNVTANYLAIANTGSIDVDMVIERAASGLKTAVVDRNLLLFGGAQSMTASGVVAGSGTRLRARRAFGSGGTIGVVESRHNGTAPTLSGVNEEFISDAIWSRVLTPGEVVAASEALMWWSAR